jgi:uncharacterized C2H2 Zn-finger protein
MLHLRYCEVTEQRPDGENMLHCKYCEVTFNNGEDMLHRSFRKPMPKKQTSPVVGLCRGGPRISDWRIH